MSTATHGTELIQMKRVASAVVVLMVAVVLSIPTLASAEPRTDCTKGDVQLLAGAGPIAARHFVEGFETGPASSFENCQFRLYDEGPHAFGVDEYFLAGIFYFVPYEVIRDLDLDRAAATAYMESVVPRLFVGPVGTPDASLAEIPLTRSPFKDARLAPEFGGHVVYINNYTIFAPGSLQPGNYVFRYDEHDPQFGDLTIHGSLTIIDG